MISVILYGRNDNHGYNYHKRLAISLNCIAEMLSNPQDEIIFADYNSPDDFPTAIEAIEDTLTPKAKKKIRILRIRPQHHRFKTHLPILETVARNVAIRRSNPGNKWILSTNSDMIFIPVEQNKSLTDVIDGCDDGFYQLPRFSLPESLWECSLQRSNPEKNIEFLRAQCKKLHLNTTVRRPGFLKYDNPGDFQLMLRKDIFQIGGFNEEMVKGWHVDSNLCKRMALLGRAGESLENRLIAFHCNHNKKESLFHQKIDENDWSQFVTHVSTPELPNQNWGLPNESIEEIQLKDSHTPAILSALSRSIEKNYEIDIHLDSFNTLTYSSARVFTSLADHLCHMPKNIDIAYIGYNVKLLNILREYLSERGFSGKIICSEIDQAYLYICDFGFDESSSIDGRLAKKKLKKVIDSFLRIKRTLKKGGKFIGINVLHTDFHVIFSRHLLIRHNGHSTGVCYGYLPAKGKTGRQSVISTLHYIVARYLFNYSDRIRSLLTRTKIAKKLFKSLV